MDSVEQTIRMNNLSKELRKYGFAQSSQEAIAQAGQIYGANTDAVDAELENIQLTKAQHDEMMNTLQKLWVFKENSSQKTNVIAEQLVKVTEKLNELIKTISLIEMNQAVFDKKLNALKDNLHDSFREEPRQVRRETREEIRESRHVEESSPEKEVQSRLDKPIDRNGVAPADVAIDNIFYCGDKPRPKPQVRSYSAPPDPSPERKVDKPIDRNGVAPADVSIGKIFYCGGK